MWRMSPSLIVLIFIATYSCSFVDAKHGFKGKTRYFTLAEYNQRPESPNHEPTSIQTDEQERTRLDKLNTPDRFPDVLNFVLRLEGLQEIILHLVLYRSVDLPDIFRQDVHGKLVRSELRNMTVVLYEDSNGRGSFSYRPKDFHRGRDNFELGKIKTNIQMSYKTKSEQVQHYCGHISLLQSGIVKLDGESCYISGEDALADCTVDASGRPRSFPEPRVDPAIQQSVVESMDGASPSREKRGNARPAVKYVELAFMPDAKFMEMFYERHHGDRDAAENEAVLFFTLLANEMNVYFDSIMDATSYQLQILIYPAVVAYPGYGEDYFWSANFNDGTNLVTKAGMDYNLEYVVNSGFVNTQFDHLIAITGYKLVNSVDGSRIVSYTHKGVTCTSSRKRYSVIEYVSYDLARIVTHELAHALGAGHDRSSECPTARYVMSHVLFSPDDTTQDTYQRFSVCSGNDIYDHLRSQSDCLNDNAFTTEQFLAAFCSGYLGEQTGYLDVQCQRVTGYMSSTACDTVTEEACYKRNVIRCRDSIGQCSTTLNFVWTGTPCGTAKYCHKGRCVDPIDMCPQESTTTQIPVTSIVPSTLTPDMTSHRTTTFSTESQTSLKNNQTVTSTQSAVDTSTTTAVSTSTSTPLHVTTLVTASSQTISTRQTSSPSPVPTSTPTTEHTSVISPTTTNTTFTPTPTEITNATTTTRLTTGKTTEPTNATSISTTSQSITTTTVPYSPCECCGLASNLLRRTCCEEGRIRLGLDCYCCRDLRYVYPPPGWKGDSFNGK